jgi:hypothetical protein
VCEQVRLLYNFHYVLMVEVIYFQKVIVFIIEGFALFICRLDLLKLFGTSRLINLKVMGFLSLLVVLVRREFFKTIMAPLCQMVARISD